MLTISNIDVPKVVGQDYLLPNLFPGSKNPYFIKFADFLGITWGPRSSLLESN